MIVARTLRRNRKITITTSASVNSSVNLTSLTECLIDSARSNIVSTCTLGGSCGVSSVITFCTPFDTSTVFTPGCRMIASAMFERPFNSLMPRVFCRSSMTLPRSPSRTGAPLR